MRRKRRSDRNHAVYQIRCEPTGDIYIGITVVRGRAVTKSVRKRWVQHLYDAMCEDRSVFRFRLQRAILRYGEDAFTHKVLKVVRGKAEAHKVEMQFIRRRQPALNVEGTGRKRIGK